MRKNGKFLGNQPKQAKAVAYCHSGEHQGYLSEKMLKAHGCLGKNCPYLEKYENTQFFKDRAKKKADKKARKDAERGLLIAVVA